MTHVTRIEAFAMPSTESQSMDTMPKMHGVPVRRVAGRTDCSWPIDIFAYRMDENWCAYSTPLRILQTDELFLFKMERRRMGSFWQRRMTIKYRTKRALLRSCVYSPKRSDATMSVFVVKFALDPVFGWHFLLSYLLFYIIVDGSWVGGWLEYYLLRAPRATAIVFKNRVEYLKQFSLRVLRFIVRHAVANNVFVSRKLRSLPAKAFEFAKQKLCARSHGTNIAPGNLHKCEQKIMYILQYISVELRLQAPRPLDGKRHDHEGNNEIAYNASENAVDKNYESFGVRRTHHESEWLPTLFHWWWW